MSTLRSRSGRAALALCAALALPLFASTALAQGKGLGTIQPPNVGGASGALVGFGKGQLELPVVTDDGRLYGVLADPDGRALFHIDAQLTGCMPALTFDDPFAYDTGGLYGKVRKLVDADPVVQPEAALYELEGTWALATDTHGIFSAVAYRQLDSGRRFVAGKVYGEFDLAAPGRLAATIPVGDAAPPTKGVKVPLVDARDRRARERFGDARSAPHKGGGKTPYDDARSKPLGSDPYGDAKSAPHKGGGKSPYGDAGSQPRPKACGNFVLRYVFLR